MKRKPLISLIVLLISASVSIAQLDTAVITQIKINYKEINNIKNWTKIDTFEIDGWSAENGQANVYYERSSIKKIVQFDYGETGQAITAYYLLDGKLSFIYRVEYQYNRPFSWDSAEMKKNNDDQVWDRNKSKKIEDRYYFDHKLLRWIDENKMVHEKRDDDFIAKETEMISWYSDEMKEIRKGHKGE